MTADTAAISAMAEAQVMLDQAKQASVHDPGQYRDALKSGLKARDLAITGGASRTNREQALTLVAELEQELEEANRDRQLLAALLDVRSPHEVPRYSRDDNGMMAQLVEPSVDDQFAIAFREWGLDVNGISPAESAAKLKTRPPAVVKEIVAALDEWASERRRQRKPKDQWQRLADLAAVLDEDAGPVRRELRAIMARGNLPVERSLGEISRSLMPLANLANLVPGKDRNRLRQLAYGTDAETEPVLGILTLVQALQVGGDDVLAERILRASVRARPQEVVLRYTLAKLLSSQQPPKWQEAVECYEAARALRPQLGVGLADALIQVDRTEEGVALMERLVKERPDNPWLRTVAGFAFVADFSGRNLIPDNPASPAVVGVSLEEQRMNKRAEEQFREAIKLKPDDSDSHSNLGFNLFMQRRYREAEVECREALHLNSESSQAHYNLGIALYRLNRYSEAEQEFREALRLNHAYPEEANYNLACVLQKQDKLNDAEAAYVEVVRLKPNFPYAHYNLALLLQRTGKPDRAEEQFRVVLRLQPNFPGGHEGLGVALGQQDRLGEAEEELRTAIRIRPREPSAHFNLGFTLFRQGRYKEAENEFREVVILNPEDAQAHYELGMSLAQQVKLKEAEDEFSAAVKLEPEFPLAHYNLGLAMMKQGRFADALISLQLAHRQGSKVRGWPSQRSAEVVQNCKDMLELDHKFQAILKGKAKPDDAEEHLELADLCSRYKQLPTTASQFYTEAFVLEPKFAEDMESRHRYNAARSAALAAAGRGKDAGQLKDTDRTRLRKQALDWLRADLAAWTKLADDAKEHARIRQMLQHWQKDPDLAGIRDPDAVAKLPADEPEACKKLWADVADLLKNVEAKK
jgi:tetratricopeptide (TPR) repeat protein